MIVPVLYLIFITYALSVVDSYPARNAPEGSTAFLTCTHLTLLVLGGGVGHAGHFGGGHVVGLGTGGGCIKQKENFR